MALRLVPIKLSEANSFVADLHRHHKPVIGHKFSLGAVAAEVLVGIVIVGRPVSRHRDDGATLEVTRLCTDGTKNACSFLYGAAARAAFALGYSRVGTYIRSDEPGTSLTAAGWRCLGERGGGSWSRAERPRTDKTGLPEYTRSIDSALSLIPEGIHWMLGYGRVREGEPLGACGFIKPGAREPYIAEEAATVPLAICIAALEARQKMKEAM